jgi:hypothetical protein
VLYTPDDPVACKSSWYCTFKLSVEYFITLLAERSVVSNNLVMGCPLIVAGELGVDWGTGEAYVVGGIGGGTGEAYGAGGIGEMPD